MERSRRRRRISLEFQFEEDLVSALLYDTTRHVVTELEA